MVDRMMPGRRTWLVLVLSLGTLAGSVPHDPDGKLDLLVSCFDPGELSRFNRMGTLLQNFGPSDLQLSGGLSLDDTGRLLVADFSGDRILRFDAASGEFLDEFAQVESPWGLALGPDGDLFVASYNMDSVIRIDGETGASLGAFASGGGLGDPRGIAFGVDGSLFVASAGQAHGVVRFDGLTGEPLGLFAGVPGLATGLAVGREGDVFVSSTNYSASSVRRLDGQTGQLLHEYTSELFSSGIHGLAVGPDGWLYVCCPGLSYVVRVNLYTGLATLFALTEKNPVFALFFASEEG